MIANDQKIIDWIDNTTLTPVEMDCVTAIMLKILDGKCKMPDHEGTTMNTLYSHSKHFPGHHLTESYHRFIKPFLEKKTGTLSENEILRIYEKRVLAETQISRPVMKKFKARLRSENLLPTKNEIHQE